MGILTLLKANIRHKKGSFVSIILLMIIISMSLTAIISVKDNTSRSIENALDSVNSGDLIVLINHNKLTDELLNSVENNENVKNVQSYPAICTEKSQCGDKIYDNPWFMQKLRDDYQLMNADTTAYEEDTPALKTGEIYLTLGIQSSMSCEIGDVVETETAFGKYSFTIKGFVAEPASGSYTMGWKQVFISDDDFNRLYDDCKTNETEEASGDYNVMHIYEADNCNLSQMQFRRQLNLDTGISNYALGSLTKDQSTYYTNLYPEIIMHILTTFIIILLVIVLIAMGHSITTSIEMDYVSLGVLKSQGFTSGKLRLLFMLQYVSAQLIGTVIGVVFAIPLTGYLGSVFQPITAIITEKGISMDKVLLVIAAILVISALFILIATRKAAKISPVRAISGGRSEIYFDSRIKAPICQKTLSASLAFRQFTSAKRQYAGILAIISLLVFFMMTIMLLGNVLTSKATMESMGFIYTECNVTQKEPLTDGTIEEMEHAIEDIVEIDQSYYLSSRYLSIDGEEIYATIYQDPENIAGISKGRIPLYDNEIVITEVLSDELEIEMGDTVTLSHNDKRSDYLVSGIFQSTNEVGRTFAMNLDGAEKLGIDSVNYIGYCFTDPSKAQEVVDMLNEKYGDVLAADAVDADDNLKMYQLALDVMKAVIYSFSILFALVVVNMVCKKTFLRERMDIGIYKSMGFSSGRLRLQFAVRFLLIAVMGSAIGVGLSLLFSSRLLITILKLVGVTSLEVDFTVFVFLLPIAPVCACFFLFAYLNSWRIRRVAVRELVVE